MKLKEILKSIAFIGMSFFILIFSVGLNVSKMSCSESGELYLGSSVPSCSEEVEVSCDNNQEKISCCIKEVLKSCCPETEDKSCASETELLHFDFETIFSKVSDAEITKYSLFLFSVIDFNIEEELSTFSQYRGIPPPDIYKPNLSDIQSFLL